MKRIMLLTVGIFMALVVAAPMVSARSNGGAPEDTSGTVVVNPGDYPGSCEFPFNLEFSGKAKTIYLPNLDPPPRPFLDPYHLLSTRIEISGASIR